MKFLYVRSIDCDYGFSVYDNGVGVKRLVQLSNTKEEYIFSFTNDYREEYTIGSQILEFKDVEELYDWLSDNEFSFDYDARKNDNLIPIERLL